MWWWLIVAGYLIVALNVARWYARRYYSNWEREFPSTGLDPSSRAFLAGPAVLWGLLFPLSLTVHGLYLLIFGGIKTDRQVMAEREQRIREQEAQLAAAKRQARALGLAWPDGPGPDVTEWR